jgi:hypothetical protein
MRMKQHVDPAAEEAGEQAEAHADQDRKNH